MADVPNVAIEENMNWKDLSWVEKTEAVFELLGKIPADIHAIGLLVVGVVLSICGHKDIGEPLITSAAFIFKGNGNGQGAPQ